MEQGHVETNVAVRPRPLPRGQAEIVNPKPQQHLVEHKNHTVIHVSREEGDKKKLVYYYDAKAATNQNGELQVPSIVYDANGNALSLNSLAGADIYLEPPEASLEEPSPPMQLSIPENWIAERTTTSQDQSIIVCTVAVMALLVGALSARRLRSRSFLSSCIENEALEDDVAYDTAYTTTDNSYNTFGGWKGDLEKFDV